MLPDHEDTAEQRARLADARAALADALAHLETQAASARKAARTKRGQPDLPTVYAAVSAVRRAEETLDQATYDVQTASGEDG